MVSTCTVDARTLLPMTLGLDLGTEAKIFGLSLDLDCVRNPGLLLQITAPVSDFGCDIDGQPEIAMWSSKPEVLISPTL